jgi:hypothetical protein
MPGRIGNSVTIAALLLASATIEPGIWEVLTEMTVASTPSESMPLGTAEEIIETSSDQLIDMIRLNFLKPDCELSRYSDSDGKLEAAQTCPDKKTGTSQWTISAHYSPFRIKGRKVVTGNRDGLPQVLTDDFEARFLASGHPFPDKSVSSREVVVGANVYETIGPDERIKLKVLDDSRCPVGVPCESPGRVILSVEYSGARGFVRSGIISLPFGEPDRTEDAMCAWTRRIELMETMPVPQNDRDIAPNEYRFRMKLGQCGPLSNDG